MSQIRSVYLKANHKEEQYILFIYDVIVNSWYS